MHLSRTDCYIMQQCVLLPSLINPVWLLWLPSNEAAIWTPYGLCQLWTSFFSGDSQLLCSVEGVVRMAAWKCLPVALPVPLLKINTKTKTVFARLSENFRLLSKKSKFLAKHLRKELILSVAVTSFHMLQIMKAVDNIQSLWLYIMISRPPMVNTISEGL